MRRRLAALPANLMFRITSLPAIERLLDRRYRERLRRHAPRLPRLEGVAAEIVTGLRTRGGHMLPISMLDVAGSVALLAEALLAGAEARPAFDEAYARGERYLIAPSSIIAGHAGIYRWGLDEALLDIAEAYLGLPAAYDGVVLQYSPADGETVATRSWHRDREDRRMIKIAIYLNDVDDHGGPFELMPGETATDRAETIAFPGPSGTAVFAETSRFLHRGRPVTGKPRLALFYSYFAQQPRNPYFCDRCGLSRAQVRTLVEGLTARQRDAALWQARLPVLFRIVPPAPL